MQHKYTGRKVRISYITENRDRCLHLFFLVLTINLVTPLFARGAEVSEVNSATGTHSTNENSASVSSRTSVLLQNSTESNNRETQHLNTGNNSMEGNTIAGGLSTGAISLTTQVTNDTVNSPNSGAGKVASDPNISTMNRATGANSLNTNSLRLTNQFSLTENNHTSNQNNVTVKANTGENKSDFNTISRGIVTGNIITAVSIKNTTTFVGPIPPGKVNTPGSPSSPSTIVPTQSVPGKGGGEITLAKATITPAVVTSPAFFPAGTNMIAVLSALSLAMIGSAASLVARKFAKVHA